MAMMSIVPIPSRPVTLISSAVVVGALLVLGFLPNNNHDFFCHGEDDDDGGEIITGSPICVPPISDGSYNNIVWNEEDAAGKEGTKHAIDGVIDLLLNVDASNFDGENSFCAEFAWKKGSDYAAMYGYIYCAVPTSKADCQAALRNVYNGDKVASLCGKYREGLQIVNTFGCCLRYEKYRFC